MSNNTAPRFYEALVGHAPLQSRYERSSGRLVDVRKALEARCEKLRDAKCSVFCAGSLARGDAGRRSDLDLFVTADPSSANESQLFQYEVFAELIQVNEELGFDSFSNDGQYLKIYSLEELKVHTGSARDDSENLFTARLLLLLESRPLLHPDRYARHRREILENYFRDGHGKQTFKPLFLLNDVCRYWRTLCLNYEEIRHDTERPWRKKNVNLKFSRMVTVCGTILPLVALPFDRLRAGSNIWNERPLGRIAIALDELADDSMLDRWVGFLDVYEDFLAWKEEPDIDSFLAERANKERIRTHAIETHEFLCSMLSHPEISAELRRYLIL